MDEDYVQCKHKKKRVIYPHPLMEEILKETYGVMVYQEQIMQTGQIIGGFSLGKSDILRRAMGKKKMDVMQEMKVEFKDNALSILTSSIFNVKDKDNGFIANSIAIAEKELLKEDLNDQSRFLINHKIDILKSLSVN